MKYSDLLVFIVHVLGGCFFYWQLFRLVKMQRKRIDELERIITQQNARHVGFLAVFEALLRKLHEKVTGL